MDEAIDGVAEGRRSDLKAGGEAKRDVPAPRRLWLMAALGAPSIWQAEAPGWKAYAGTAAMVLLALGLGLALQQYLASLNIALVFLTAVLASAVAYGLWPSLFASLRRVLAYNVFFLPPLYTVTIADPENVVAMFFFVIVAVIVSNLTSRVRSQAIAARQRAQTMEELYLFSRKLGGAVSLDDLLRASADQIALMLKLQVVLLLLSEGGDLVLRAAHPPGGGLSDGRSAPLPAGAGRTTGPPAAARDAHSRGQPALPAHAHRPRGRAASSASTGERPGPLLGADQRRLLDALLRPGSTCHRAHHASPTTSTGRGWRRRPTGCARPC